MNRSMWQMVRGVAVASLLAVPMIAQAQAKPVVAVLSFDNGSYGPGSADFNGLEKGISELLVTELASANKFRVVERSRIQALLDEQNLAKSGSLDATTAIRVGKLVGACYAVFGSFISGQGQITLTAKAVSMETGVISNPQKIQKSGNDVMGLINEATAKINADLKLDGCPTGARSADAAATQQSQTKSAAPAPSKAAAAATAPEAYAKPISASELTKLNNVKLDVKTALVYSKALDALDMKDTKKARDLLQQVLAKNADFQPAKDALARAQAGT